MLTSLHFLIIDFQHVKNHTSDVRLARNKTKTVP